VSDETETLFEFPCDYPIKVMGRMEPGFDSLVLELVRRHAPDIREGAVSSRPSKGGKWISVTVTLRAESKSQLDAIYLDLTAHEKVVMAL
jgi:putative lipoic acid-binding regulatory protein